MLHQFKKKMIILRYNIFTTISLFVFEDKKISVRTYVRANVRKLILFMLCKDITTYVRISTAVFLILIEW